MSSRYKVNDDDPEFLKVAKILIDQTSGPITTWLAAAIELDANPKTCTEAAAIAFATQLSFICEHMAVPLSLAKRTWTALVCQRIYTHMTRLLDAEELSEAPKKPNESLN